MEPGPTACKVNAKGPTPNLLTVSPVPLLLLVDLSKGPVCGAIFLQGGFADFHMGVPGCIPRVRELSFKTELRPCVGQDA